MVTSRMGACEDVLCFSKSRTKSAVNVVVAYRVNCGGFTSNCLAGDDKGSCVV